MELPFTEYMTSIGRKSAPLVPFREMAAYEALWQDRDTSFKKLSDKFAKNPHSRPSDLISEELIAKAGEDLMKVAWAFEHKSRSWFNLLINGSFDYPEKLRQAVDPVELLYYTGDISLLSTPCVSVVGTRNPSAPGVQQAMIIAQELVAAGFTVVSGLAKGVDTVAHKAAISAHGKTIAVIGTPLNVVYPQENAELQSVIAKDYLLVSQVPFLRYQQQTYHGNKWFFPERNKTMSALSDATVIVEAGETSGTLVQAAAALAQRRKLFIHELCFSKDLTWPDKFVERGAFRFRNLSEILKHL